MRPKTTEIKILQYLYSISSVPRKQLKIAIQDVTYDTVARATRELLSNGYVELVKKSKGPTHIKITRSGISYLAKIAHGEIKPSVRNQVTSAGKKERLERVQKTVDMCKAAEIRTSESSNISFSIFAPIEQSENDVIAFSNIFVDEAIFFRSDEITKTIKQFSHYGEEITQTQSRFTGIIINKNGLWFVYHTLNKLMRYSKNIEGTLCVAVIAFIQNSWVCKKYPQFFLFLKNRPNAIVIGDTPSLLPKIYTGRKWGETESDTPQKKKIAGNMGTFENILDSYASVEFVPNNNNGRNYLYRITRMSPSEQLDMCRSWAKTHDYICVASNGMFQISKSGTSEKIVVMLTINMNILNRIRNSSETTSVVIEKGMADSISRILGLSLGNIYDYNMDIVQVKRYNMNGVRADGINPLTGRGHIDETV